MSYIISDNIHNRSNNTSKTDVAPWCYKWVNGLDGWVSPGGGMYRAPYGANKVATFLYYPAIWLTKAIRQYISNNLLTRSKNNWLWLQKACFAKSILSSTGNKETRQQWQPYESLGQSSILIFSISQTSLPVLFKKNLRKIFMEKMSTNIYMTPDSY